MTTSLLLTAALCALAHPPQDVTAAAARDTDSATQATRPLELMDVFDLEYADDPRIAPDGEHVVYVRTFFDVMKDRRRGNLWIVGTDGSGHRPLTSGTAYNGSPRWSPSGDRLVYLSSEEGSVQLWCRWMDTGETASLTRLTSSPGRLSWSPDGRWIAFLMGVPAESESFASMPAKPKGAEWAEPARVIDTVDYRSDGSGFVEPEHTQLFVVPAEGGTPRQLTHGAFDVNGTPSWTPDGASILVSSYRGDEPEYATNQSDLYEVIVATGEMKRLTDAPGPESSPVVSPDGRWIAFTGFEDRLLGYQQNELFVADRDGTVRFRHSFDRSIDSIEWSPDGAHVLYTFDDFGVTKLARTKVVIGGAPIGQDVLIEDLGGTSLGRPYPSGSYTQARDGSIAVNRTSPARPADVFVRRADGELVQVTQLNEDLLGNRDLGAVEEIRFESSHDGLELQGWIVTPPDFDPEQQYPLILEIHGGPFLNYGPRFTAECQLFAAAGYVVLYMNPRGSTSYGADFGNEIHHAYPGHDYDDLMDGVDAVIERGYVDPERLFVTGGSGGGVLTAWIVGTTDRFAAAVVAKPVINWYSFVLTADAYLYFAKYWFGAMPWEAPGTYLARSPISRVGNVTTPTMLLTGEDDLRTPISETEQFYQALKLRKIDTAMVRIPGASHGITARPSNLIAKVVHILEWFERHDPGRETDGDATSNE
ncbi:Prolyl tripeptidyl peptidase precursor [Planctomycetes bacterium Pla163]|uniref:Prolyl tripeptidyl peptidase n=1 Tax=Rohdeia mirabilis TaxID=2528008 RepID=A0A518D547_9BACT|nr:Prolyl tripeptidyl peptidase precursor [Planctomycetes bacterium Pla163]